MKNNGDNDEESGKEIIAGRVGNSNTLVTDTIHGQTVGLTTRDLDTIVTMVNNWCFIVYHC